MHKIIFNETELYTILGMISKIIKMRISIFEPTVRVSVFNTSYNYVNCVAYPAPALDYGFCYKSRFSEKMDNNCLMCDKQNQDRAIYKKQTHIYQCHLGLTEALIPILYDNDVVALIFIGQIIDDKSECASFDYLYDNLLKIDSQYFTPERKKEFEQLYNTLNVMSSEEISSICKILEMIIPYLWENKLIVIKNNTMSAQINDFVNYNINNRIKIDDMSKYLNISRSHLCRIIKKEFGMSFSEYINRNKLEKACDLLRNTDLTIKEIAVSLGYNDANFFSRIFKKNIGVSAQKYRKMRL